MAGELIGFEIEGIEEVQMRLKRLGSAEARREMSEDVAKFLRAELQKYPSPKRVTRKQAYGVPFFTDRQRRYFFWALGKGIIKVPYTRTRQLMQGWKIEPFGKAGHLVVNEVPYGQHVQQQATQSRMAKMIGWKTMEEIIKRQSDKIRNIANKAMDRFIRKIGL